MDINLLMETMATINEDLAGRGYSYTLVGKKDVGPSGKNGYTVLLKRELCTVALQDIEPWPVGMRSYELILKLTEEMICSVKSKKLHNPGKEVEEPCPTRAPERMQRVI